MHYQLVNPSIFRHLSTQRNSFHRINVTRQIYYHNNGNSDNTQRSQTLAAIVIDSDVDTPVFRWWDGSISDIRWLKEYMDYMRYEILKPTKSNKTLVIGTSKEEDILVTLAEAQRISLQ